MLPPNPDPDSLLQAALAEELRRLRTLVEQVAELVIADAQLSVEHLEQLQNFDLIVQCAGESAAVLDRLALGATARDAIAPVRLTAIQDRLSAALDQAA